MKIQNREITMEDNYLNNVTYVPSHVNGNAGHKDCEQGVIVDIGERIIKVLYCKNRSVRATNPDDLVWG